jgi:hypothetical protein
MDIGEIIREYEITETEIPYVEEVPDEEAPAQTPEEEKELVPA